jgi:hypothetical protein
MSTKRTPIDRPPRIEITARAVALWEQIQVLECTCAPRSWGANYWNDELCDGCAERNRLRRAIHAELRLKPWEIPAVMAPDTPNPFPAGSPRAKNWRPDQDAVARWEALAEASRERQAP